MKIDIKHLASLAALRFTPEQETDMVRYLESMLTLLKNIPIEHFEKVPPTYWLGENESTILDPDVPRIGLGHQDIMAIAPDKEGPYLSVPREGAEGEG